MCIAKCHAVAGFKIFRFFAKRVKTRFKVKSCGGTITSQADRNKHQFFRPKKDKSFRAGRIKERLQATQGLRRGRFQR